MKDDKKIISFKEGKIRQGKKKADEVKEARAKQVQAGLDSLSLVTLNKVQIETICKALAYNFGIVLGNCDEIGEQDRVDMFDNMGIAVLATVKIFVDNDDEYNKKRISLIAEAEYGYNVARKVEDEEEAKENETEDKEKE